MKPRAFTYALSDNASGIVYMLVASACLIVNDTSVKLASQDIAVSQIIVLRSLLALGMLLTVCWWLGLLPGAEVLGNRFLWLRTAGELGATGTYLSALARLELASATAILQTAPLVVTVAAAVILRERVALGRWIAIAIGLFAVLLIIRPGTSGFTLWSLVALASVGFIVVRDLSSRMMPAPIHPITVALVTVTCCLPLGLGMSSFEPWLTVTPRAFLLCLVGAVTLSSAFAFLVLAMRAGDVAVVSPFRYSLLLWAVVIQIVLFSTWPDLATIVGSVLLVATGLYTFWRR